jgi:hypothetical protein
MATRKIQMRPPDNNYADVLHPETDTTMVLLPDGSVLQDQLVAPLSYGNPTAQIIDAPGITMYTHLRLFQFIAYANNGGAATTLKVSTLPARPLYLEGTVDTAPNLIAGKLYTVWADNIKNCFFLKASGSGNAVAADLLAGKTATTDNGPLTGTMPNNGDQTATLEIANSLKPTIVIPDGYTPGGTITAQLAAALASKIQEGETIGGVLGTLAPGKKWATGTVTSSGPFFNITGLAFVPSFVIFYQYAPASDSSYIENFGLAVKNSDIYYHAGTSRNARYGYTLIDGSENTKAFNVSFESDSVRNIEVYCYHSTVSIRWYVFE